MNTVIDTARQYGFRSEGRVGGDYYVTVIDNEFNPVEYNVEYEYALNKYGPTEDTEI